MIKFLKDLGVFLKPYKTTISALAVALISFLKYKQIIDSDTAFYLGNVLIAMGLALSKDFDSIPTSEEIQKQDEIETLKMKKVKS